MCEGGRRENLELIGGGGVNQYRLLRIRKENPYFSTYLKIFLRMNLKKYRNNTGWPV